MRTPGNKLLEAIDLVKDGATPQELMKAGFKQDMAYRAARAVKTGQVLTPAPKPQQPYTPSDKQISTADAETGEVKPKQAGYTYKVPMVGGKVVSRSQAIAGGGVLTQDYLDPDSVGLEMKPTITRITMPHLLPTLIAITKLEWGWGSIPVDHLLNLVIDCFLRDRGILAGAYHKLTDVEEFIQEVKGDGASLRGQGASATQPETPGSATGVGQQATGDNQEAPVGAC